MKRVSFGQDYEFYENLQIYSATDSVELDGRSESMCFKESCVL